MQYKELKELIDYFGQFEHETGLKDISGFAYWLNNKVNQVSKAMKTDEMELSMDELIMKSLGMLSNHAKHYVKTAIKGTPLVGWNDLVILLVLFYQEGLRKTELIQSSLIDLSPGIEVIKRLQRNGLIEEYGDPKDKRAKLVKLTESGRSLFQQLDAEIDIASKIVAGNLTPLEKQQLIPLLQKLVHFHDPIFRKNYGTDLKEIIISYQLDLPKTD